MDEAVKQGYRAYMLRLRRTDGAHSAWRATLEEPTTGERHAFASLDEMTTWLREQTSEGAGNQAGQRPGWPQEASRHEQGERWDSTDSSKEETR
jgi:hypothetical protein